MRNNHYLKRKDGYSPLQLAIFERERIATLVMCAKEPQTHLSIGKLIGMYQAKDVLEGLRLDGYLIRYHHTPTGETRYKLNSDSIKEEQFFLGVPK